MTVVAAAHTALLRELLLAGYKGDDLLAAFERAAAAIIAPLIANLSALDSHPAAKMNNAATHFTNAATQPANAATGPTKVATSMRPPRSATQAAAPAVVLTPPDKAKAIGHKALTRARVPARAVAVGAQLLEHFNLETRRCDPGIARIAALSGLPTRSVRRGIADLQRAGLFAVLRHGGRAHTNAYFPNWPVLEALARDADRAQGGQKWPGQVAKTGPQNHISKPESIHSLWKHRARDRRQIPMVLPIPGGRDAAEAKRDAAQRRLWTALRSHLASLGKEVLANVLPAIPEPVFAEAVRCEEQRSGAGLGHIMTWLDREGPVLGVGSTWLGKTGTGPP